MSNKASKFLKQMAQQKLGMSTRQTEELMEKLENISMQVSLGLMTEEQAEAQVESIAQGTIAQFRDSVKGKGEGSTKSVITALMVESIAMHAAKDFFAKTGEEMPDGLQESIHSMIEGFNLGEFIDIALAQGLRDALEEIYGNEFLDNLNEKTLSDVTTNHPNGDAWLSAYTAFVIQYTMDSIASVIVDGAVKQYQLHEHLARKVRGVLDFDRVSREGRDAMAKSGMTLEKPE